MKILFSPSEAKTVVSPNKFIDKDGFIFPNLYEKQCEILKIYNEFIPPTTAALTTNTNGREHLLRFF